jgi:hypothetical protein
MRVNNTNNGRIIRIPSSMKSIGYDLYDFYWFCDCFKDSKMRRMTCHLWDYPVKSIMEGYCPCETCRNNNLFKLKHTYSH